jgi:cell division protein FtsB
MIFYFPNYSKLKKLKEANRKLSSQIKEIEKEIEELERKIENIDDNALIYEEIARDQLSVAKENEIVVDIKE